MRRRIDRLEERLGGIRNMKGLPSLVFIVPIDGQATVERVGPIDGDFTFLVVRR